MTAPVAITVGVPIVRTGENTKHGGASRLWTINSSLSLDKLTQNNQTISIMEDTTQTNVVIPGAFLATLTRNNSKIRADRALAISEDAQTLYKRQIEDMEMELKRLYRERVNMLDLSPTDSTSLKLASDFNAQEFVAKDIELGVRARNLVIKLDIARESYKNLFGAA